MSTRRCDLAPPPSRCARHRRGYFERRVVAGSCIYNGQGCASAAAACCDWEGPLPARAREAAPSRASGDDPGRGCPRAAPCKARGHNYPLPLSGQVFPSSLLAHSFSLSRGAPPPGAATAREAPAHAHRLFLLFLPVSAPSHMVTSPPPPLFLFASPPSGASACLRGSLAIQSWHGMGIARRPGVGGMAWQRCQFGQEEEEAAVAR